MERRALIYVFIRPVCYARAASCLLSSSGNVKQIPGVNLAENQVVRVPSMGAKSGRGTTWWRGSLLTSFGTPGMMKEREPTTPFTYELYSTLHPIGKLNVPLQLVRLVMLSVSGHVSIALRYDSE